MLPRSEISGDGPCFGSSWFGPDELGKIFYEAPISTIKDAPEAAARLFEP